MNRKREPKLEILKTDNPDQVEQASMDSFPARDPPGWIYVRAGSPERPPPEAISKARRGTKLTKRRGGQSDGGV